MDELNPTPQVTQQVQVQVETPPPAPAPFMAAPMYYASFLERLVATLIDGVILFAISFGVSLVFNMIDLASLGTILTLILSIGYSIFFIGTSGATPGKKVMHIKVIKTTGEKPNFIDAFLREVIGKFVSGLILYIGFLWMLWDDHKQCLHDKIAHTYVIKS